MTGQAIVQEASEEIKVKKRGAGPRCTLSLKVPDTTFIAIDEYKKDYKLDYKYEAIDDALRLAREAREAKANGR